MNRENLVLDCVRKNPMIRFNSLMAETGLANGTLSYYVKKLEDTQKISVSRKTRVTRICDVALPEKEAKICRHLDMDTQREVISILAKKGQCTQVDIRKSIKKSPSVISTALSNLFTEKIIIKEYDIPSNKYSLKEPELVRSVISAYFPTIASTLSDGMVEMTDF